MKSQTVLAALLYLLAAYPAAAQDSVAQARAINVPVAGEPVAESAQSVGVAARAAHPHLELTAEDRQALDEARDLRRLKAEVAAMRQLQQGMQGEIEQLRACVKSHEQKLPGAPVLSSVMRAAGPGKPVGSAALSTQPLRASAAGGPCSGL